MKLVYSHPNFTHAGLMRGLLEAERIPVVTRNERLMGEIRVVLNIELWVADEDFLLAQSLVREFDEAPATPLEDWACPRCGAQNDGNMALCWNCDWQVDGPTSQ